MRFGQPDARVAREVLGPAVGLGLDDARDARLARPATLVHETAAEQRAGDDPGVAREPAPLEALHDASPRLLAGVGNRPRTASSSRALPRAAATTDGEGWNCATSPRTLKARG